MQLFGLPLEEMSPTERAELGTLMDRAERHWGVGPLQPGFNKTLATGKHACMRLSKKCLRYSGQCVIMHCAASKECYNSAILAVQLYFYLYLDKRAIS